MIFPAYCTVPILERRCDGGKGDMIPEQIAEHVVNVLSGKWSWLPGCSNSFQWWWGAQCICPHCGVQYQSTWEHLKRYRLDNVKCQQDQDDEKYTAKSESPIAVCPIVIEVSADTEKKDENDN